MRTITRLALPFAFSICAVGQQPSPPSTPIKPAAPVPPPAVMQPQKDETAVPAVSPAEAQKAAQQNATPSATPQQTGTRNMVYDTVPFTVRSVAGAPNSFQVHVEARGLVWHTVTDTEPARFTQITLTVSTFDKNGMELSHQTQKINKRAPPNVPSTGRIEVPLDLPYKIPANPMAVRARFVVRVEVTGRMSTADLDLTGKNAFARSEPITPTMTPSAKLPAGPAPVSPPGTANPAAQPMPPEL